MGRIFLFHIDCKIAKSMTQRALMALTFSEGNVLLRGGLMQGVLSMNSTIKSPLLYQLS
jgi:hypothetical protein